MVPLSSDSGSSAARSGAAARREPAVWSSCRVIQGGMGAGVSGWRMASAVASAGQLGVVSGTGLDTIFVRRLQDGDEGGHLRRAMAEFPVEGVAADALARWFRPHGRAPGEPYALLPLDGLGTSAARLRLIALASFVEVRLAKHGHDGPVGMNLLTKIAMPNLPSLYGAMLAGVDAVLMGAGIPRDVPAALDALADGRPARLRLEVEGMAPEEEPALELDPASFPGAPRPGHRPAFLPIVSSHLLASVLVRKSTGRVDGLVVEGPTAGGHNAPPRDPGRRNERGEPVYGEKDAVDLDRVASLGLPFWLAGGTGWPSRLAEVRAAGATGVQVGTLFAFCRESGLDERLRREALELARRGELDVLTDPQASPTGFPFKVVRMAGTLSDEAASVRRARRCDLGYLRIGYRRDDGGVGFRCPAEPVAAHVAHGGAASATAGRRCLCNALMANVGLGQLVPHADGMRPELPLLTAGDDARALGAFLAGRDDYSVADVLAHLLG